MEATAVGETVRALEYNLMSAAGRRRSPCCGNFIDINVEGSGDTGCVSWGEVTRSSPLEEAGSGALGLHVQTQCTELKCKKGKCLS